MMVMMIMMSCPSDMFIFERTTRLYLYENYRRRETENVA